MSSESAPRARRSLTSLNPGYPFEEKSTTFPSADGGGSAGLLTPPSTPTGCAPGGIRNGNERTIVAGIRGSTEKIATATTSAIATAAATDRAGDSRRARGRGRETDIFVFAP